VARLRELGFEVYGGVRRSDEPDALILDVTKEADVAALRERFAGVPLAGLVNNAGIAIAGPLEYLPLSDWRRQLEVNVIGVVAVTQALLEPLRAGGGRVVNISSVGGRAASPFFGPYSASKFALEGLSDALRQELRPWRIPVSVVEPGAINTGIWDKGRTRGDELIASLDERGRELYGRQLEVLGGVISGLEPAGLPAEAVADVVAKALCVRRPRTRYVVGRDARLRLAVAAVLPERWMDALVAARMGL
jgi:NAD(P)-dependent dehydrogenase (short-subunit alcohol dehydrogenase family)